MLNKAILMGRLTKDPAMTTSPNGVTVTRFTLAVDRRFQRQGEEKQADFLNIVCFNKTAEFVSKYFIKGQIAIVVGSIQVRTWDGPDGKRNYMTEIVADDVSFGASKKDNPAHSEGSSSFGAADFSVPQPANNQPAENGFMPLDDDDTLPF